MFRISTQNFIRLLIVAAVIFITLSVLAVVQNNRKRRSDEERAKTENSLARTETVSKDTSPVTEWKTLYNVSYVASVEKIAGGEKVDVVNLNGVNSNSFATVFCEAVKGFKKNRTKLVGLAMDGTYWAINEIDPNTKPEKE